MKIENSKNMKRRRLKINMKTSGSEEELKVQVTKATT
jgi:hypothetical protein